MKSEIELLAEQLEKGLDTTQRLVEQLAQRGEVTIVAITSLKSEVSTLSEIVKKLSRIIFDGNGSSLVTRVAMLENNSKEVHKKVYVLEKTVQIDAISDATEKFKVKILWGSVITLLTLLAAASVKLFFGG